MPTPRRTFAVVACRNYLTQRPSSRGSAARGNLSLASKRRGSIISTLGQQPGHLFKCLVHSSEYGSVRNVDVSDPGKNTAQLGLVPWLCDHIDDAQGREEGDAGIGLEGPGDFHQDRRTAEHCDTPSPLRWNPLTPKRPKRPKVSEGCNKAKDRLQCRSYSEARF